MAKRAVRGRRDRQLYTGDLSIYLSYPIYPILSILSYLYLLCCLSIHLCHAIHMSICVIHAICYIVYPCTAWCIHMTHDPPAGSKRAAHSSR